MHTIELRFPESLNRKFAPLNNRQYICSKLLELPIMKKFFFLFASVAMTISAMAQDVIITTDAQKIDAKIIEVSKTEIKYKEKDNPNGPTFVLEAGEISSIIYANGKVVLYNQPSSEAPKEEASDPQPAAVVTSSNVAEANNYNAEILLLSGQIIKGRLMEVANNYVAYTFNAKYFTMPASQVEKVTDLRNGKVTVYNGRNLDQTQSSSTSAATSPVKKNTRIYRDNGEYMYNNTYISQKEVVRILKTQDETAYRQWKKGEGMLIAGSLFTGIGGSLALCGFIPLATRNYGACIGMECGALGAVGIGAGLILGASMQYNKAIDIYNSKHDRAALQLRWFASADRIGLALAF